VSQAKEGEKQQQVGDGQPSTEYQFAALFMAVARRHRQAVLDVLACVASGPKKPSETPSKAPSKARGPDQGQGQARARDAPASPKA
jgi:hypothetical protein